MMGVAGVLTNAIGVIGRIRRVAGSVQSVRGEFRDAGGGIRGVIAGARMVADKLLPETAQKARQEIHELRSAAMSELNGMIGELRDKLAILRAGGDPPAVEAAECRLAAAMQARLDLQKASVECERDIQLCELECIAHADICDACGGAEGEAAWDSPREKPVVPFLRQGIQERHPHAALRAAGCYFFALFRWAEHALGRPLGEDMAVPLFEECVRNGSVRANAFVNDPVKVLNTLCGERKFSRVSVHTNDPGAEYTGRTGAFIRRVYNGNLGVHFVLDINGYTWDSLGSNAHNYRPAGLRKIV